MNKATYSEHEIEAVLAKARARNKAIGNYTSHTMSDEDYFSVTLSNGRITLFTAEVKNAGTLLPDRINDISARFHAV